MGHTDCKETGVEKCVAWPTISICYLCRIYLETALLVSVACKDSSISIEGKAKEHQLLKKMGCCGGGCKFGCSRNQALLRATHFLALCKKLPGIPNNNNEPKDILR
jgi:hypothetical protein